MPLVAISGTGLIGGSIGLGLAQLGWDTVGWDPDPSTLARALERGIVAAAVGSRDELVGTHPDLMVLAGPPQAVLRDVSELQTDALVIDVAGVKQGILEACRIPRFVGTHPMAGREISGPDAATAALFRGASWVIVADGADPDDVATVDDLVTGLGARPVHLTAAEHDAAVATISHLPQVLAAALLRTAAMRGSALDLAAGSFRDLTRVASSDPGVWEQILDANRSAVQEVIRELQVELDALSTVLGEGTGALRDALSAARDVRTSLGAPVVAVRVALADRPGELARVGHALERSAVDVRDLQLRHSPHGGGGVLTLSVRPGDAEPLRAALTAEDLLLAE